jgi:ATP/ADP translocase
MSKVSWPTAAIVIAVVAAIALVLIFAPPETQAQLLAIIGSSGTLVAAIARALLPGGKDGE